MNLSSKSSSTTSHQFTYLLKCRHSTKRFTLNSNNFKSRKTNLKLWILYLNKSGTTKKYTPLSIMSKMQNPSKTLKIHLASTPKKIWLYPYLTLNLFQRKRATIIKSRRRSLPNASKTNKLTDLTNWIKLVPKLVEDTTMIKIIPLYPEKTRHKKEVSR